MIISVIFIFFPCLLLMKQNASVFADYKQQPLPHNTNSDELICYDYC